MNQMREVGQGSVIVTGYRDRKRKTEFTNPEYIYLKDVNFYRGSLNDFVFTQHRVCNLSLVDAFSIGDVTIR